MTVGASSFSTEDRRRQLEGTFDYWEQAGPRAIWDATWELTSEWLLLRDVDPSTPLVGKDVSGILPVPWMRLRRG